MAKNKAGRPLKFKTVKELQKKCDAYFKSCYIEYEVKVKTGKKKRFKRKKGGYYYRYEYRIEKRQQISRPLTITGLALALDTNRQTLLEYEGEVEGRGRKDPRYADTIKKAKLICENFAEEYLYGPKNIVGAIFNLKNNYGWKEKSEIDLKGKLPFKIINVVKDDKKRRSKNVS